MVEARFDGGQITSDGGSLLLRQADRYLGLTEAVARALPDPRRRKSCIHDVHALVRQRVYAVALGYEDLDDHDELRREVGLQTAVERDRPLASASMLCRFENRADAAKVAETGDKVRRFVELTYGARTWDRPRRVIAKGLIYLTPTPLRSRMMRERRVMIAAPNGQTRGPTAWTSLAQPNFEP